MKSGRRANRKGWRRFVAAGLDRLEDRLVLSPEARGLVISGPDLRDIPVEHLTVQTNGTIDTSTLTLDDLTLTRDGLVVPMTGGVVTGSEMRIIGSAGGGGGFGGPNLPVYGFFNYMTGLGAYTGEAGEYHLTVSMAGVTDLSGNPGRGTASVSFTNDPVGPWLRPRLTMPNQPPKGPVHDAVLTFNQSFSGPPETLRGVLHAGRLSLTRDGVAIPLTNASIRQDSSSGQWLVRGLAAATRASGTYRLAFDPSGLVDSLGHRVAGTSMASVEFVVRRGLVPADHDGDGISDLATYTFDEGAGSGRFDIRRSGDGLATTVVLGARGAIPVDGDFDGDGRNDPAVYDPDGGPDSAVWTYIRSSDGATVRVPFGAPGAIDLPAPGDFDGDGTTDIATFRASSDLTPGSAEWFIRPSSDVAAGYSVAFGAAGGMDLPAVADYDGDYKDDLATFRASPHAADYGAFDPEGDGIGAQWFLLRSTAGAVRVEFGGATDPATGRPSDQPAPGYYYDSGGKADLAAFRVASDLPGTTGKTAWFRLPAYANGPAYEPPLSAATRRFLGTSGDVAAPGDYDGDGTTDLAVLDTTLGRWTILDGRDWTVREVGFGPSGASAPVVPVLAPLHFRLLATASLQGPFEGAGRLATVAGAYPPSLGGLAGFGLASADESGAEREEAVDRALDDLA
jgi:hypothetical protein